MKKTFLFALLSLVLVACSQDEPVILPDKTKAGTKSEHRVSLDDALKTADALLAQIGNPDTRSKSRRVANVKYLTSVLTRSGAIDTMLYLVNYENNEGFALLGADNRIHPVYAISDEGQLNMEDTVENKGLAMFFRNTEVNITSLNNIYTPSDSLILIKPPKFDETPLIEISIRSQIKPLLGVNQRIWGQNYPYNQYCFTSSGIQAVVGCTALGTAQIMSYYEWPASIGSESFPWESMNAGTNNERIAKLLSIIGSRNNLSTSYGQYISQANINNCIGTFINLGYENPGEWLNFNEDAIVSILNKTKSNQTGGGPILISGWELVNNLRTAGHTWVIDGYIQYQKSGSAIYGVSIDDYLFHCIWGSSGNCNGYYYWAKTNSFSGSPIEKAYDDYNSSNEYSISTNYDDIMYLGGFIPKK